MTWNINLYETLLCVMTSQKYEDLTSQNIIIVAIIS